MNRSAPSCGRGRSYPVCTGYGDPGPPRSASSDCLSCHRQPRGVTWASPGLPSTTPPPKCPVLCHASPPCKGASRWGCNIRGHLMLWPAPCNPRLNNPPCTEHPLRPLENIFRPCSVMDGGEQFSQSPPDASAAAPNAPIRCRGCSCCQQEGPFPPAWVFLSLHLMAAQSCTKVMESSPATDTLVLQPQPPEGPSPTAMQGHGPCHFCSPLRPPRRHPLTSMEGLRHTQLLLLLWALLWTLPWRRSRLLPGKDRLQRDLADFLSHPARSQDKALLVRDERRLPRSASGPVHVLPFHQRLQLPAEIRALLPQVLQTIPGP